jgi:hypothetical protein
MARLMIVLFLILVIVFTYSAKGQGEMGRAWEMVRPGVIQLMDGIYATIRNFVAGNESNGGIHDDTPGVNFDEIITMSREFL